MFSATGGEQPIDRKSSESVHGYPGGFQSLHFELSDNPGCLVPSWRSHKRLATKQPGHLGSSRLVGLGRPEISIPPTSRENPGEVAERSKAPVHKTGSRKGTEGSNPSFTTERNRESALPIFDNRRAVPRRWVGRRMTNRSGPTSSAPQLRSAATVRRSGAPLFCQETEAPDA